VETLKHGDSSYTPLCDVSESISCSRAFLSKYGKGFGLIGSLLGEDSILNLPNAVFGIIFYPSVSLIGLMKSAQLETVAVLLALGSSACSVYLMYALYVLRDFCIVCVMTYVVNFLLVPVTWARIQKLNSKGDKKE
jgi:vitamin-K-epoxide reductase (warfarin-sensitive)